MSDVTIIDIPQETMRILCEGAAKAELTLEEYVRGILYDAALSKHMGSGGDLYTLSRELFDSKRGVELELPERFSQREGAKFD
ncbi:MAG: hypothetical protein ACPGN3_11800 [Opitutales bacterium]